MIHQDAAHRFGGGEEEVPAAMELLIPDEAKVRFVDEGGGVERVVGRFAGHLCGGEFPKLAVHERKQGGRGVSVAPWAASRSWVTLATPAECNRRLTAGNSKATVRPSTALPDGYDVRVGDSHSPHPRAIGAPCRTDTRYVSRMPKKDRKPKARTPGEEWFVYMVRCGDGSLYTGIAKDVA